MKQRIPLAITRCIIVFLVCLTSVYAKRTLFYVDDSPKLYYKATERFKDKLDDKNLEAFKYSFHSTLTGGPKLDRVAASELVYSYARASDTRSSVKIIGSKGPGAVVKYQTLGQRMRGEQPTTAKQPTESTDRMYIGRYHIWLERNQQVTSDKNSEFEIINPTENVSLEEPSETALRP